MPYLSQIAIYPIKSLGPVCVNQTRIVDGGGLEHDRELALFDEDGKFVNAKRTARFHFLSSSIDWKDGTLTLYDREKRKSASFHLHAERVQLEAWLSEFFQLTVSVRQNARGGYPDDLKAPGPTLIGASTLREVATWYERGRQQDMRIRFRANLEIADAPPFWEDRLYGEADSFVAFRVGKVILHGTNPCQRCVVPTRELETGVVQSEFSQIFRAKRQETLPDWANQSRFNHYYRLAVNTQVPLSEIGKILRVGDEIAIV
jgi:uncharacterized protein YcbX